MNIFALVGHFLIGFYYVFFGFSNIYHWDGISAGLKQKKFPFPHAMLAFGIAWEILFGTMIIFNILVPFAALMLIPFTLVVINVFHPFWMFKDDLWRLNFTIFITNCTVVLGGLIFLLQ